MRPLRRVEARALDLRSARLPYVSAVALTSAHLYGFEATSQWFKRLMLDPYLIKRSEGITYLCFDNQLNRPIALGLTATLKSFGDFRRISLAGRSVAAILPSVEGSLRNSFGMPKLFLRRIPEIEPERVRQFFANVFKELVKIRDKLPRKIGIRVQIRLTLE